MKSLFQVTIAALVLGALISQRPMATAQKEVIQPSCVVTVPSAWGEFKGASGDFGLAFQDSDGTLRFVRDLGCEMPGFQKPAPTFLEVRRK